MYTAEVTRTFVEDKNMVARRKHVVEGLVGENFRKTQVSGSAVLLLLSLLRLH